MKILTYSSLSEIEDYWNRYFVDQNHLLSDYALALYIEQSLFDYDVEKTSVLVFIDDTEVKGILPISYEKTKGAWCYYPSYIFISPEVTIDPECWSYLHDVVPKPFIMYETSIKTVFDLSKLKIPWLTFAGANVIDLTKYKSTEDPFNFYLSSLDKKTRSKFRNCLNRNQDLRVEIANEYIDYPLHKIYKDYCNKFEDTNDFTYFKNQLELFPTIFERASKFDQLIVLKIYMGDTLIALNYSIFDDNCLYDYICYRETNPELEKRSLGTFAILKNIQYLLENQKATTTLYYDLASEFAYKKQFLPNDSNNQYIRLFLK